MFHSTADKPVIVQSDYSLLLDVHHPQAESARTLLAPFCELFKSPEHIHTYRITPISLWNAAGAGVTGDDILQRLTALSKYEIPPNVSTFISEMTDRFGKLLLLPTDDPMQLQLEISDPHTRREILSNKKIAPLLIFSKESDRIFIHLLNRGLIKQALIQIGFPVKDLVPLRSGDPLSFHFRSVTLRQVPFSVRDYQKEAASVFYADNQKGSGYGTIVLPCGAGKTIVGMAVMEKYQTHTLILTTNVSAVHQWKNELLDKTDITEAQIGEYTGLHDRLSKRRYALKTLSYRRF